MHFVNQLPRPIFGPFAMNDNKQLHPLRNAAAGAVGAVWWYFLLRGLLLLGVGIIFLVKPSLGAVAFAKIIGGLVLADGLITAAAGISGEAESRAWSIIRGLLMLLAGLFVFLQPALVAKFAVTTLMFIIAPFVVINGILEIVASLQGHEEESGKSGSLLSGILTLVLGVLLFITPLSFGVLIVRVLGIVAILIGLILLFLASKFHKLRQRIEG
jgi:uncharacterized membrane protein HdeD (DUF308 family)